MNERIAKRERSVRNYRILTVIVGVLFVYALTDFVVVVFTMRMGVCNVSKVYATGAAVLFICVAMFALTQPPSRKDYAEARRFEFWLNVVKQGKWKAIITPRTGRFRSNRLSDHICVIVVYSVFESFLVWGAITMSSDRLFIYIPTPWMFCLYVALCVMAGACLRSIVMSLVDVISIARRRHGLRE